MIFAIERVYDGLEYSYRVSDKFDSNVALNVASERFGRYKFKQKKYDPNSKPVGCNFKINDKLCSIWLGTHLYQFGNTIDCGDVNKTANAKIFINGVETTVYYCQKRGSNLFNGIYYSEAVIDNDLYQIYEVGVSRKQHYFCIWKNGELIAVADHKFRRKPVGSIYVLYSSNCIDATAAVMLLVYSDLVSHRNDSTELPGLITWQKELKNKFNPDFIPRIKAQDGIK